jgi:hypothetical protein
MIRWKSMTAAYTLATILVVGASARAQIAPGPDTTNYQNPPRDYVSQRVGDLVISLEKQLIDENPGLAQRALARLAASREEALQRLPPASRAELRAIPFYLMYGSQAHGGGRDNGIFYAPSEAPLKRPLFDARWGNVIVVRSANNYASISEFWSVKSLIHEFSHAHHLLHRAKDDPDLVDAWQSAVRHGLYRHVVDERGRDLDTAYAAVNALEYFAELSAMYFFGCNYPPKNRSELLKYDPRGAALIAKWWGVHEAP